MNKQLTQKKELSTEEKGVWNIRTLPREIIKWIQGLDLSYSVKDPRKDLNNGFLVAEILSRYYPKPGIINMHSFDNSQNFQRRKNNWELLDLFFKKNELPLQREDWRKILMDNDAECIINFIQKLYQFLTQRKIAKPPLASYLTNKEQMTGTISDQQGTTSFLLKDKGLEKMEEQKEKNKEEKDKKPLDGSIVQSEKKLQLSHASSKRTNFLRVPSKPISQNIEAVNYQIDVKKLNVRQITGSVLDLKEAKMIKDERGDLYDKVNSQMGSTVKLAGEREKKDSAHGSKQYTQQQQQSISQYGTGTGSQDPKMKKEKKLDSIMDIINTMLMDSLSRNEQQLNKIKIKNSSIFQVFSDSIDIFDDEFVASFFMDINHSMDAFLTYVQKDTNELWKFFNFMFTCLNNLDPKKESLILLVELIKSFGLKSVIKDAQKTKSIFIEFFLPQLSSYIKQCITFEKKEMLFSIVYSFCPNDPIARHQMISALKFALNDVHTFMQALVVLVQYEENYEGSSQILLNDFKYFIKLYLLNPSTNLRTMSLALLDRIAEIKFEAIQDIVIPRIDTISKNQWWENRCLAIIVFSKIVKGITKSEKYLQLIKNPQSNQKFFSVENEKMVTEMKQQINQLSLGIKKAASNSGSDFILSIAFIYIVELLGESKVLLELFLELVLNCSDEIRNWVLYSYDADRSTSSRYSRSNRNQQDQQVYGNPEPAKQAEILNYNNVNGAGGQGIMKKSGLQQQLNNNSNLNTEQEARKEPNDSIQDNKDDFIYFVTSDKSLKYKNHINSEIIKQYASDILMSLVQMIETLDLNTNLMTHEYMELITYCFYHTDFKVINVESCEKIANTLKEYIFLSLCDEELTAQAKNILMKLLELQFHADIKIKKSELVFSSAISLIYESNFQKCIEQVELILQWLMEDYRAGIENVKNFVNEVYRGLLQRKSQQYKQNQNLLAILEPVIEYFKKDENQLSQMDQNAEDEVQGEEFKNEESAIIKGGERGIMAGEGKEQSGIMEKEELSEILNAFQPNEKDLIQSAQKWTPSSDYVITLIKDQFIPIPEIGRERLVLGVGWTPMEKKDLDAGIVMFDKNGVVVDTVNYMKVKSKDQAIFHKGDNTHGKHEGDDEKIEIDLKKLDPQVDSIWVFISVYSSKSTTGGQGFNNMADGHYRIQIKDKEFCKFDWKFSEPSCNGCIACDFSKINGVWTVRARGYYTKNTPKLQDSIPIIQQVLKGNMSLISK